MGTFRTLFWKVTTAMFYLNLGMPISLDDACATRMSDVCEFTLYKSAEDEDGESHAILLTLWQKGTVVAHQFDYAVDSEYGLETRESGDDPTGLVDELPEAYQVAAQDAVDRWCTTFLSDCREMHS